MSFRRPPAAVVFDLDGTLIDSRRDLATAVNRLRDELGLAELPLQRVEGMVGEGARMLVARALADGRGLPISAEGSLERFLALYEECCLDTTAAYDGIPALLADLAPRAPLAVLTNKPYRLSRRILAHLGLLKFFRLVVGGDGQSARKPDPAGLLEIAAALGVAPSELVLVGDSRIDLETAAAAGCALALVEWGYGRAEDLAAARPALRARSVEELAARFSGGGILSP